jgi:hypothetical protein
MAQLHELLAAEKTATNSRDAMAKDTLTKFEKGDNYFTGFTKTLKLLGDDPNNEDLEKAARQDKTLPTTVLTTLDYFLSYWAKAEDVLASKNLTNTTALANIEFRGQTFAENVPVDELMGLEVRLGELRKLAMQIPTLDASKDWRIDPNAAQAGTWKSAHPSITTKTEKQTVPVVLYPHSDKHPAQVKEVTSDKIIGTFTQENVSGATTAIQKAQVIATLDELITAVKQARTRANSVPVMTQNIGRDLIAVILEPLRNPPVNNQV